MNTTNILSGDDLKRELFIQLYGVKKQKKFIEDIYDMLETEEEKRGMINFLKMRKKLTTRDVELKALEITEPQRKRKKSK